jgi:hypothetical protein
MGWLWTLQIIVDILLIGVVWRLTHDKNSRNVLEARPCREERIDSGGLQADELVRYQEELGRLSADMEQQAERLIFELEQRTRAARQVIRQLEKEEVEPGRDKPASRAEPVAAPVASVQSAREGQSSGGRDIRQAVMQLEAQGCSAEDIARRLKLGKREVQLLLALHRR